MAGSHFIDSQGTGWMILPGVPDGYPEGGEGHGLLAGLTFRASTGEVRVLPRAGIPRRVSIDTIVAPLATRSLVWPPV